MPNNMPNNNSQPQDSTQLDGSAQQPDGNAQQSTGNGMGGKQMGGSQAASEIAQWVEENFTSQTVDGVTLYDLTQSQQ